MRTRKKENIVSVVKVSSEKFITGKTKIAVGRKGNNIQKKKKGRARREWVR